MNKAGKEFIKGLWKENPVLVLLLGLCPALAVTSSAYDGLGMGFAMTAVLLGSNIVVSLIRKHIPKKVRIPCFIVIIAAFVTIIDMVLEATLYNLHRNLGLFIPLIVVNCIILGRAEAFASKNSLWLSLVDALGMGLGFTVTLFALGAVREILGNGTLTLFQHHDMLVRFELYSGEGMVLKTLVFILPPGAFISLGLFVAGMNAWNAKKQKAPWDVD